MMWMVILLAMQGREAEQAAREFDEGMRQFQENRYEKAIEAFDAADPGALAGLGDVSPKILAMLDGAKGR
jgi:hypothetical protein